MRMLNGSNVIIGFQPILCSHCAACAQEMEQNPIDYACSCVSAAVSRSRRDDEEYTVKFVGVHVSCR